MGVTATVLGFHHSADRGSVLGQSDDELVAGVRSGEPAAFEEIYDRYAPGLLAFCVHMLGSREAAEDALQLTLVSAYRALRNGENSIALRPWLYAIARNRCLSELRGRRDAVGVDELTDGQPVFEGLADQVLRREDLREMLDDMQRLPADQRAALVLFELGDHPQKEIATVLGVRTEKVKALVFQAREALVRGRTARQHPCGDIREQVATMAGRIPARSLLRAHIDRCPGCQSYEHEVSHQRTALALIVPVALAGELKTSILGSVLHGGGAVAAACSGGGGVVVAGAGSCGSGAVVGGVSAVGGASALGGASAVGGIGGSISAVSAATAGGVASAGIGAVATSAPVIAAGAGLAAIGESVGVGGLSATGVVAKLLTAAAIATVAASAGHSDPSFIHRATAPPTTRERLLASIPARPSRPTGRSLAGPFGAPLPAPGLLTSTAVVTPPSASSTSATTSNGATSTSTSPGSGSGTTGGSTPVAESGLSGAGGASSAPAGTGSTAAGSTSPTTTPANPPGGTTTAPASDPTNPTTSSAATSPAPVAAPPANPSSDAASAPVSDSTGTASGSSSSPSTTSADASAAGTGSAAPGSSTSSATGGAASDSSAAAAPVTAAAVKTSSSVTDQANVAVQSTAAIAPTAAAQSDAAAAN